MVIPTRPKCRNKSPATRAKDNARTKLWQIVNHTRNSNNVNTWHKANAERKRAVDAAWKKRNPDKVKAYSHNRFSRYHLPHRYGLTEQQYNQMLSDQLNGCAVCGVDSLTTKRRLEVDHDHISGRIRGLLCGPCNRMLGQARDNPEVLESGAIYLRHFKH